MPQQPSVMLLDHQQMIDQCDREIALIHKQFELLDRVNFAQAPTAGAEEHKIEEIEKGENSQTHGEAESDLIKLIPEVTIDKPEPYDRKVNYAERVHDAMRKLERMQALHEVHSNQYLFMLDKATENICQLPQ